MSGPADRPSCGLLELTPPGILKFQYVSILFDPAANLDPGDAQLLAAVTALLNELPSAKHGDCSTLASRKDSAPMIAPAASSLLKSQASS